MSSPQQEAHGWMSGTSVLLVLASAEGHGPVLARPVEQP